MPPKAKHVPSRKTASGDSTSEALSGADEILGGLQSALDHLAGEFGWSFQELESLIPASSSKAVSIEVTRGGFRYVLIRTPCSAGRSLSRREEQVARLASEGLPNSKIARRLRIRTPTVATHMRNIYRKLDVKSRWQIAQRLPAKS